MGKYFVSPPHDKSFPCDFDNNWKKKPQKRLTKGKGRKRKVIAAKIKMRHFQPNFQDRLKEQMELKLLQCQDFLTSAGRDQGRQAPT